MLTSHLFLPPPRPPGRRKKHDRTPQNTPEGFELTNRPRVEDLLSRLSATGYGDKLRLAGQGGSDGILRGILRELDTAVLLSLIHI